MNVLQKIKILFLFYINTETNSGQIGQIMDKLDK